VKDSKTAMRAKAAAFTAAKRAKEAYEALDNSSSSDEINAAQWEASSTQSHAIHATVVEYEANIAKKRAAVSLANDVKCWNAHRRREMLQSCIHFAKAQRDACRQAAEAWESLRGGIIESSFTSVATGEIRNPTSALGDDLPDYTSTIVSSLDEPDVNKNVRSSKDYLFPSTPALETPSNSILTNDVFSINEDDLVSSGQDWDDVEHFSESDEVTKKAALSVASSSTVSHPEAFADTHKLSESHQITANQSSSEKDDSFDNVYHLAPPNLSHLDDDHFALHNDAISSEGSGDEDEATDVGGYHPSENTNMTMSMQSLIDGLLSWGGDDERTKDLGYQAAGNNITLFD
jgi:hypothetical protein